MGHWFVDGSMPYTTRERSGLQCSYFARRRDYVAMHREALLVNKFNDESLRNVLTTCDTDCSSKESYLTVVNTTCVDH